MSESIHSLPLAALRESPTNPRRQFDDRYLAELAESIRTQGLLQPIVVRPLDQADIEHRYEIVFGHCRSRAAALAGLEFIPCFIRELTDEQVGEQQLHENLHRRDITAVEEADALAALVRTHRVPVDDLVQRTGKSKAYIYGQLKLADAAPELRQAVLEQGLSAETARMVARLPGAKAQHEALKRINDHGTWASSRDTKARLRGLTRDTATATWVLTDETAHGGACSTCPKLCGNDPELAGLGAGACIDVACFDAKMAETAERLVQHYRQHGHIVIEGDDARRIAVIPAWLDHGHDGYISTSSSGLMLDDGNGDDITIAAALRTLRGVPGMLGAPVVTPTLIVIPGHESRPIEALPIDQAAALMDWAARTVYSSDHPQLRGVLERELRVATNAGAGAGAGAGAARDDDDADDDAGDAAAAEPDSPAVAAMRHPETRRRVADLVVGEIFARPRTVAELRLLVVEQVCDHIDIDDLERYAPHLGLADQLAADRAEAAGCLSPRIWLESKLDELGADRLGALLVAFVVEGVVRPMWSNVRIATQLAEAYGVDPAALPDEPASAPPAAATTQAAAPAPVGYLFGEPEAA